MDSIMDSMFDNPQLCQDVLSQSCLGNLLSKLCTRRVSLIRGEEEDDDHQSKRQRIDTMSAPRRIPCKARGMSENHNADLAYFEITADTKHGQIITCSHYDCVASGRQFRYCGVCALPVAKRNFMKRHAHDMFASSKELMDADMDEKYSSSCNFLHNEVPVQMQWMQASLRASRNCAVSWDTNADPLQATMDIVEKPALSGDMVTMTSITDPPPHATMQLNEKEFMWVSLFHNRPLLKDVASTSNWMDTIIKLSEDNSWCEPSLTLEQEVEHPGNIHSNSTTEDLYPLGCIRFPPQPCQRECPRTGSDLNFDAFDLSEIFEC